MSSGRNGVWFQRQTLKPVPLGFVIPTNAGIQDSGNVGKANTLDPRLRGDDDA